MRKRGVVDEIVDEDVGVDASFRDVSRLEGVNEDGEDGFEILYGALRREMGRMWSKDEIVSTFLGTRAKRPEEAETTQNICLRQVGCARRNIFPKICC